MLSIIPILLIRKEIEAHKLSMFPEVPPLRSGKLEVIPDQLDSEFMFVVIKVGYKMYVLFWIH